MISLLFSPAFSSTFSENENDEKETAIKRKHAKKHHEYLLETFEYQHKEELKMLQKNNENRFDQSQR